MTTLAHLPINGQNKQNLSSPEQFFVPHPAATDDDGYQVALALLEQVQSGLALLLAAGQDGTGFTVRHNTVIGHLHALNTITGQAVAALNNEAAHA